MTDKKDKKTVEFEMELEGMDGVEYISVEEMEKEAFELISHACYVLGWAVGVPAPDPNLGDDDVLPGLVVGEPAFIQEITDESGYDYEIHVHEDHAAPTDDKDMH